MSSWIDRSMPWLGAFPLAVELANTVVTTRTGSVDLMGTDEELARWMEAEVVRFPVAEYARGHLNQVRALRGEVRELLFAAVENRALPESGMRSINDASARSPRFPILGEDGSAVVRDMSPDGLTGFFGAVARSVIEVIGGEVRSRLGICGAPSCGMFFVAGNQRQTWCSPACGNRGRVARHAARTRKRSSLRAT